MFGSLIAVLGNGILLAPPSVHGGSGIPEDVSLPDSVRFDQREKLFADEEKQFGLATDD